jgi:2-polyprenyl-6-methoxyphenol hydroxylase-like FAD-dependent oxidoreductase
LLDLIHLLSGEGVNMAMLNTLELWHCLIGENFPDIQSAIAIYEKQMRARASETAQMTLESTAALHSENAISFLVNVIS